MSDAGASKRYSEQPERLLKKTIFVGMNIHRQYMSRCLELALNGLGLTYPNPLVGSVIVYKDTIIGEGWHQKAGGPHAEVAAIESVLRPELLKDSVLYVNLEPCSHYGKTPPCSDLIVKMGIRKVVVGTLDPNVLVAGKGVEKLKSAGIDVTVGVLEESCNELNKRFFTLHGRQRPYVILKWAESSDGFIAPLEQPEREPVWISGKQARMLVHKWRTEENAILVGSGTALKDNPKLNARDWSGNQPIRILLDRNQKVDQQSHLFNGQQQTIVFSNKIYPTDFENVIFERLDPAQQTVPQVLRALAAKGISSVIVEGGKTVLELFIASELWDEARIFKSRIVLQSGVRAPQFDLAGAHRKIVDKDELLIVKHD